MPYVVDVVSIGGRNLIRNTSSEYRTVTVARYNVSITSSYTFEKLGLKVGDTIIYRIYINAVDSEFGARARINLYYNGTSGSYDQRTGTIVNSGEEGYAELTYVVSPDFDGIQLQLQNENPGADSPSYPIDYKWVKLEKGSIPTDWTPAFEDQVSDWNTTDVNSFSFIKNKPTSLSQFTDNIGVAAHIANKSNPHSVTKAQVGLGNVDNTADSAKNVLSATTATNLSRSILAGNGLTGGGVLNADRTITLGTPSTITNDTTNSVTAGSHTHAITGFLPHRTSREAENLDTWRTSGVYAVGNNNTNLPSGAYTFSSILISQSSTDRWSQLYMDSYSGGVDRLRYRAGTKTAWGAWKTVAYLDDNVASATKLQTPRTIWGQSFDGTGNVTGALSGATTIAASISVTSPKVIFNAAGWSMEQVGSELQMKHNNVLKMRFTSTGSIVAINEITAFG